MFSFKQFLFKKIIFIHHEIIPHKNIKHIMNDLSKDKNCYCTGIKLSDFRENF